MGMELRQLEIDQLTGWHGDNHAEAMRAFLKTARRMFEKPYKSRPISGPIEALQKISRHAINQWPFSPDSAKFFFENYFQPFDIIANLGEATGYSGFVTAYYEPEVAASRVRTDRFCTPLLRRPNDLVDVTDDNRPSEFDPELRFARLVDGSTGPRLEEYPDRAAIGAGCLDGQNLEIAWVKDPVEALFVHIQGSARLRFENGSSIRVGYAAKNGHPYTAVGKVLLDEGELTTDKCGMQSIRDWFAQYPTKADTVINRNRSFIFFNEYKVNDEAEGPIGAAKVDLTSYRSLAVDRLLHTFGTPVWLETSKPLPGERAGFARLMVAQDTGSAIVGPARGDLFLGSGCKAGKIAGEVRHAARFVIFKPKRN